ncbi:hypothetical protein CR513_04972, partial [Mucuna pruriens]
MTGKETIIKLAPLPGTQVLLSSTDPLYAFDPEIELTLRRLRKIRNAAVNISSSIDFVADSNQFYTDNFVSSSNVFAEPGQMENNDRTLKELATPDVEKTPQTPKRIPCDLFYNEAVGDIGGLYQDEGVPVLPGWSSKRLDVPSASTFQHLGRHEVHILGEVLSGIQNCDHPERNMWNQAACRFNKLCATCPHHQISKQLLIQYFYEGLSLMDKSMIDAASGEALMDKTPATARHLISNMASNTQQFGIRGPNQPRMVNEIGAASNQRLENQLTELTSLVRQLAVGQHQPAMAAKVCGICTSVEHPTDMCPTLQETEWDQPENVGVIGGFQYGKQPYQNRPFDSQQHGRQPFRPRPNQGPYAAQQFGSTPNTYQRQAGYQALHNTKHHLSSNNNNSRECLLKATLHLWRT